MDAGRTEIVLVTRNRGRISEFRVLLKGMPVRVLSLLDCPDLPCAAETGKTFREVAEKKAKAVASATGKLAVADGSGLEVLFLDGKPSVSSGCFAGEGATGRENARRVLKLLDSVPWEERGARLVCAVCVADPKGKSACAIGLCEGTIGFEMRGTHGLGYDPIFVPRGYNLSLAEMAPEVKNHISHTTAAMDEFLGVLNSFLLRRKKPDPSMR